MSNSDILEDQYAGDLARTVQGLPAEEKEKLDWSTRQFLSLEERIALVKNTELQWGIFKYGCKPFTLGLFKDLYMVISPAFFGRTSEAEIFTKCAPLVLQGKTPGAEGYLRSDFAKDVVSENGEDIEKYLKAEEIMGAVAFFSIHYWRFGEKLKANTSVVVENPGKKKSPKAKSS